MSELTISKSAYFNNLEKISSKIGDKNRVILVLKDNAYGHGLEVIAPLASEFGIKFVAVKNEYEAKIAMPYFEKILILSHIPNGEESANFIYALNDIGDISKFKVGTKIHIKVDTLMHRNGICLQQIKEAFEAAKVPGLVVQGAFTHFRSSDEMTCEYFIQRQNFAEAKQILRSLTDKELTFHSHNSAGCERFIDLDDEMIRVGMLAYGYSQFLDDALGLKIVAKLWAHKVSARILKAGQSVGYGAKFSAKTDTNIATYDLGYGDGLLRYDGEGELKVACGERILGKMSMDSFSLADVGEKVCVFDDARIWARFFKTIEYDVLVKLSPLIKRVVVD